MLSIDFCDRCGCPQEAHVDGAGNCLHCLAFPERGTNCSTFLPRERPVFYMNYDALGLVSLLFTVSGLLTGVGFGFLVAHYPFAYIPFVTGCAMLVWLSYFLLRS